MFEADQIDRGYLYWDKMWLGKHFGARMQRQPSAPAHLAIFFASFQQVPCPITFWPSGQKSLPTRRALPKVMPDLPIRP